MAISANPSVGIRPRSGLYPSVQSSRATVRRKATDFKALAEKINATDPDLVYYGGITQNNAGQLYRDIRDAIPDVKLMGPGRHLWVGVRAGGRQRRRGQLRHVRRPARGQIDR
ncbi:MAG: hypothetical protein Q7S35_09860 [Candidatus Limnocylindrales bacterium]|nr:hypothetical protein [Candidatus Limnocylindrales bacterium]